MMSKREYKLLAEAFKALRWHNRHDVIDGLMLKLKELNPRFDELKFAEASQYHERFAQSPWRYHD